MEAASDYLNYSVSRTSQKEREVDLEQIDHI